MREQTTYAVYFHPQALEVLGEAIRPYLTEGQGGQHVLCQQVDFTGGFCELSLTVAAPDAKPHDVDVLVPSSMVRLIVSVSGDEVEFGFT